MKFYVKNIDTQQMDIECYVVFMFENSELPKMLVNLDTQSKGYLSKVLSKGDMTGAFDQELMLYAIPGTSINRLLIIGCGSQKDFSNDRYKQTIKSVSRVVSKTESKNLSFQLSDFDVTDFSIYNKIRIAVEELNYCKYNFTKYQNKTKEFRTDIEEVIFHTNSVKDLGLAELAITHAVAISQGRNYARDLKNTPPNIATPEYFKLQAEEIVSQSEKLSLTCLNTSDMQSQGMGCLLAVGSGSQYNDYLINIEYNGGGSSDQPTVLVGKGVTFDTGGICVKPPAGMHTMKMDMGGAAAVLGVMKSIAYLELPINVVGTIAVVENSVSDKSYRPGDVLTSLSGQTVEVLNTDAEGRLILADALTYIEKYNPAHVIDIATLTGAMIVALGAEYTGVFGSDVALINDLINAGKSSGDLGWHMPICEAYHKQLKSDVADFSNLGDRSAGSGTAAAFLSKFTEKYKWAHLDIAGSAMGGFTNAVASGRPVPMIMQYLLNITNQSTLRD